MDKTRDKISLGPIAWILPWGVMRRMFEQFSFFHINVSFRKGTGTVPAEINTFSSKQGRAIIRWRSGRTVRSLITPLVPFGLLYLAARLGGGTTVTRINDDGQRFADYRVVQLDRDYYLAFATEQMVTVGSICMALSEALDLARNGQRATRPVA